MGKVIEITVRDKIATTRGAGVYICGNSDFMVNFDFDEEWDLFPEKTARFIHNGRFTDVLFQGNQCAIPLISNTFVFKVGVYAGELHTTTPATVVCKKSILCGSAKPDSPAPDDDEPTAENAVRYDEQTLTKEQQEQARENIGAASQESLSTVERQIADLLYKAIDITSFTINPTVAEMGATVDEVVLRWAINKNPATLTVEGKNVAVDLRETTLKALALKAAHTFQVSATDERGATDSMSKSLPFYNGAYYGLLADGAALDSAAVLTLTRALTNSRVRTFSVNCGQRQRIAYAIPTRFGTPVFKVGGFEGGFYLAATIDFINASGYTEQYAVWLSSNTSLGSTTVEVS